MQNFDDIQESGRLEEAPVTDTDKKHPVRSQLLTVVQLIICVLIICAALVIKTIGGTLYANVGTWFFDNYNNSVFTGMSESSFRFTDQTSVQETSRINAETSSNQNNNDIITDIKSSCKMPLKNGTVTSPFGNRENGSEEENHKGIDIGADKNSEIYAMLDGKVTVAKNDPSYGNYIVITHENDVKTLYAHCEKLLVKQGDSVKSGQKISLVGSTGDADGNHLHLEILIDGKNIDPQLVLGKEYT